MPRVLGIVMAGGRGDRLQPLTRSRSKAAVPFGARHRLIDYVLSNFVNSGIYALYVLVQYKSQSLIEHVSGTWRIGGRLPETFVTVVPPQMRGGETWYRGTADAVFQNLNLIRDFGPELVAVFGADHVYRMDLRHMIQFHLASRADVSVAARPVPLAEASEFGVITTGADGRINAFAEKPRSPEPMPGDPTSALGSMGNYVFATEVLVDALREDAARQSDHDFGRTIIPELLRRHRLFAYNFRDHRVPGVRPHEEPAYWRDVGTIRSYYEAQMDQLGAAPAFDLDNPRWPIFARSAEAAARLLDDVLARPEFTPQPADGITYAEKIAPEDRELDLSLPAHELVNRVRALSPHIGARAVLDGRPLLVWKARAADDGSFEPLKVQPEGGRRMTYDEYLRGRR